MTRYEIGTFPIGQSETFAIGPDAVAAMMRDAVCAADLDRAEEEQRRQAAIADAARAKATRSARAASRLKKALKLWRA